MKTKKLFLAILLFFFGLSLQSCEEAERIIQDSNSQLTEEEVARALKEALKISSDSVSRWLNKQDAYFKDLTIKILFPPEAIKVKNTLENNGLKWLVDDVVLKMNRTAEQTADKAKPIFWSAVDSITISDAMAILNGSDSAATLYLKKRTYQKLYDAYYPEIQKSMQTVGLQETWKQVMSAYNLLSPNDTVNTDITDYTTRKALDGLFYKISLEEKAIRENPLKRVTELLQKVFGSLDG